MCEYNRITWTIAEKAAMARVLDQGTDYSVDTRDEREIDA